MNKFYKLKRENTNDETIPMYKTYSKVAFEGNVIEEEYIQKSFDFAYDMAFTEDGKHREYRSGGTIRRRNGEIFANTFQGKLSEFSFYQFCLSNALELNEPDVDTYSLGKWDDYDFKYQNYKISLKSTKSFGQLLLLETKDWNENGEYIPNLSSGNSVYDFFVMIRINPSIEELLKLKHWLYNDYIEYNELKETIKEIKWEFDIPGFLKLNDFKETIIRKNFILPQNSKLNGRTKMDASNYYVQANNLDSIKDLLKILR